MSRMKSGIWKGDPTKGAPVGASLQLEWMNYFPLIPSGAGALDEEWTHFGTSLLALYFTDGSRLRADGSAVLIGPGLAIAARHVFDPILDDIISGALSPMAASVTEDGIVFWRVHQIVRGDTDVALLRLDLACDFPTAGLRCATLSTRTPAIGEPVMIAGVRNEAAVEIGSPLGIAVRIGIGEVSEIFAAGRDRVMLPNPCIAVRCLTVGGMSGGPAFDKNGHLIGILTSSFDGETGPSYVSLWWPTAGHAIESVWPPGIVQLPTNLLELAPARGVMIERAESLQIVRDAQGRQTLKYTPWT